MPKNVQLLKINLCYTIFESDGYKNIIFATNDKDFDLLSSDFKSTAIDGGYKFESKTESFYDFVNYTETKTKSWGLNNQLGFYCNGLHKHQRYRRL